MLFGTLGILQISQHVDHQTAPSYQPLFEFHVALFVTAWREIQTDVAMIAFFILWVIPRDPDDTQSTRNLYHISIN